MKVALKMLIYNYKDLVNTEILIHKALKDVEYVPKLLDIVNGEKDNKTLVFEYIDEEDDFRTVVYFDLLDLKEIKSYTF